MFTARSRRRGFTLVEVLVAVALTGIGIASVISAIGAMTKSQTRMLQTSRMQRLATEKFEEIVAIQDFTTPSGDFTDRNDNAYTWEMTTSPVSIQSSNSTQNLVSLSVTVHPSSDTDAKDGMTVTGLVYQQPQTTTTTTPAAPTGGPGG